MGASPVVRLHPFASYWGAAKSLKEMFVKLCNISVILCHALVTVWCSVVQLGAVNESLSRNKIDMQILQLHPFIGHAGATTCIQWVAVVQICYVYLYININIYIFCLTVYQSVSEWGLGLCNRVECGKKRCGRMWYKEMTDFCKVWYIKVQFCAVW